MLMDRTDELWTAIRRVLPDAEEVAAAVAAELGEPLDDVRPSVLIGTIALNGQLGPEAAAAAAIEAELVRLQPVKGTRPPGRLSAVDSLDDLLAETRALEAAGSLDLETIVAIQRASGAIAARTGRRIVVLLHRYAVTRRLIWEHCVAATQVGGLTPGLLAAFGRFLSVERTHLARRHRRLPDRRATSLLARRKPAGCPPGAPRVVAADAASEARLRASPCDTAWTPTGRTALSRSRPRPEADPMPERPGIGEEELEVLAGRIGHLLRSSRPGRRGHGVSDRLPVLPLMGRIAVFARDDWARLTRVPSVLDTVLGVVAAPALSRGQRRNGARRRPARRPGWRSAHERSPASVRSPGRMRISSMPRAPPSAQPAWLGSDLEHLALERLLLADRQLADATVRRELGPLLADERFGEELIETLQAYFDAGENVTAAARRLHLATRTVAYRLEKIASLLGHPLDGENGRRLSTALMVHRLRSVVASVGPPRVRFTPCAASSAAPSPGPPVDPPSASPSPRLGQPRRSRRALRRRARSSLRATGA
jgi:hypothetical protein